MKVFIVILAAFWLFSCSITEPEKDFPGPYDFRIESIEKIDDSTSKVKLVWNFIPTAEKYTIQWKRNSTTLEYEEIFIYSIENTYEIIIPKEISKSFTARIKVQYISGKESSWSNVLK